MARWPSRDRPDTLGRAPRTVRVGLFALLVMGLGATIYLGTSYALLAKGLTESKTISLARAPHKGGTLVICGGGRLPDQVRDSFIELAGGPHARIVVIPTAHAYADGPNVGDATEAWRQKNIESLKIFHTRSRDKANDTEFVRPLAEATGVWFGGGLQQKLTEVYLGTEVERQLMALLARGGVIGGTSAGAAVMSRVMITSGRTEAALSEGFNFFPGAVIDQHFLKRNRIKRLLGVVRSHSDLVGLGVDEQTALVVDIPARRMRVIGKSYVVACVPENTGKATTTRLEILKPGDEADLTALRAEAPHAVVSSIDLDSL